ncbi:lysine N(6)-hydroxylase/L-ornithine N(5)-oxygenase family protein [Aquimarina sediminis]|uniref:lysine N(6)-hydroxylase/L-ornithine N(5)-oxygenase family protein n=1 Tax=Aquimarina sediminis TaxID=2070536 RepID=UPI000CA0855D|nr:SidA/IucD/PvdA family monooxygenase [Aquimarina sediminis]
MKTPFYDLIGVGIGPANLSLSALLTPVKEIKSLFLDMKASFIWHEGMLLNGTTLQVSFLKDLVTLVDPTNPFSFLNFLSENKRIYRFSIAGIQEIKRKEFDQYYKWAIRKMNNLVFNDKVISVKFVNGHFIIGTTNNSYYSKNLVIGTGLVPSVPKFEAVYFGDNVFHSSEFLKRNISYENKKVVIIGGGQSGAEIVNHLINLPDKNVPRRIDWVSKRYNFLPMDDSPFTNELYTPSYSEYFFKLHKENKRRLIKDQKLTSDGISESLLLDIYQKLYEIEVVSDKNKLCYFHPSCELNDIFKEGNRYKIVLNQLLNLEKNVIDADIVILATGYKEKLPDFMESIKGRYKNDEQLLETNDDFSLPWYGPDKNKIYVQNGARKIWGVPNPNLSLNAWRAAKIINSILEKEQYRLDGESSVFDWKNKKELPKIMTQRKIETP